MPATRETPAAPGPQPDPAPGAGAEAPALESPREIREALASDPAAVTNAQLLALVVATGATASRKGPGAGRSRSCVTLGADLLADAGGALGDLVRKTHADEIHWPSYGIGMRIGARVIAAMELAERWRRGLVDEGEIAAGRRERGSPSRQVFTRAQEATDVQRLAILLSTTSADLAGAEQLIRAYGSAAKLVATLSLDAFEPSHHGNRVDMLLPGTEVQIAHPDCCRLLAAVELARRYARRTELRSLRSGAPGLSSAELQSLLDPTNPIDPELRQGLLRVLETHPGLAEDFRKLDQLVADAGAESYPQAVELHQMFELLRRRRRWTRPAEVLGEPVPFAGLLSIAAARIRRARRPPERVLEVQERLRQAEREAVAAPVARFVDALSAASISESGAEKALEEARRAYVEQLRGPSRQPEALAS